MRYLYKAPRSTPGIKPSQTPEFPRERFEARVPIVAGEEVLVLALAPSTGEKAVG